MKKYRPRMKLLFFINNWLTIIVNKVACNVGILNIKLDMVLLPFYLQLPYLIAFQL